MATNNSVSKTEKKFQQRSTLFVDESFFEFFVGQDDVDEGEDVEVEEYGEQAQELIHELVLSIKNSDREDQDDVGEELSQPCPEGHIDVGQVLLLTSLDHIWKC